MLNGFLLQNNLLYARFNYRLFNKFKCFFFAIAFKVREFVKVAKCSALCISPTNKPNISSVAFKIFAVCHKFVNIIISFFNRLNTQKLYFVRYLTQFCWVGKPMHQRTFRKIGRVINVCRKQVGSLVSAKKTIQESTVL